MLENDIYTSTFPRAHNDIFRLLVLTDQLSKTQGFSNLQLYKTKKSNSFTFKKLEKARVGHKTKTRSSKTLKLPLELKNGRDKWKFPWELCHYNWQFSHCSYLILLFDIKILIRAALDLMYPSSIYLILCQTVIVRTCHWSTADLDWIFPSCKGCNIIQMCLSSCVHFNKEAKIVMRQNLQINLKYFLSFF